MNSTEFFIAAGDAICIWGKTHNEACFLGQLEGVVVCVPVPKPTPTAYRELIISKSEVLCGMCSSRWNEIGSALYTLYCKEKSCQAHLKR